MDPPPLAPIQPMMASSSAMVSAAAVASSAMPPSSSSGAAAAEPDPSTQPYHVSPETIRVYAETLNTALGEEVAKELAEEMTFRLVQTSHVLSLCTVQRDIAGQSKCLCRH